MMEDYSALFCYDETSASGLRWKVDRWSGPNNSKLQVAAGDVAGSFSGYWAVRVDGVKLLVHRVVYALTHGEIPVGLQVDHIDGDTSNNIRTNLRLTTAAVNCRNKAKSPRNTSGFNGVSWKLRSGHLYAAAYWMTPEGEAKSKLFAVSRHGLLPAFSKACSARNAAILQMNENGAGYTERHGE